MNGSELLSSLNAGAQDEKTAILCNSDGIKENSAAPAERAGHVIQSFMERFGDLNDTALFSGPGRTEIGGNHTDHQHGMVLCGSVDMDMLACAAPNGLSRVRILSEGYPELDLPLENLLPQEDEKNTSAALVRGIASAITERGYALAGFDAYIQSAVLSGSGLSSSAAYEILVGNIFNHFFCGGELNAVEIAKIGQFAENGYFGKPCGLMDQMGSSVGGAVMIDFRDPGNPVYERIDYDFTRSGHTLCIIDTCSDHADMTDEYAAIPQEMRSVAAYFGKEYLRNVEEDAFYKELPMLRVRCGDRAVLRAMHFFSEERRVLQETEALKAGDFGRFLSIVNESGLSSELLLQNVRAEGKTKAQAVALTLALGRRLLNGQGAIRVHGGGFAGTVQAYVPDEMLGSFISGMEAVLGKGTCHILHIRPYGGCVIMG